MERMNLLYCGNRGVFDGVMTSALSVVRRLSAPRALTVYIFTMELSSLSERYIPVTDEQAELLRCVLRRHNPDTEVCLIDVSEAYRAHFAGSPNEGCYCSPYTLLRLFAELYIEADKLLYLDADTMFVKDPLLLYEQSVEGVEYAASTDHYGKFFISPRYINAGVLLFNMSEARRTGLFVKAREWIGKKKLPFADQSALLRATTRRRMISQRFNDQKFLYKGTVLRHFSKRLFWFPYPHTENVKQWQVSRMKRIFGYTCFDDCLDEYLAIKEKHPDAF